MTNTQVYCMSCYIIIISSLLCIYNMYVFFSLPNLKLFLLSVDLQHGQRQCQL